MSAGLVQLVDEVISTRSKNMSLNNFACGYRWGYREISLRARQASVIHHNVIPA